MLKNGSQILCCFEYTCLEVCVAVQKMNRSLTLPKCPSAVGTARLVLDSPWCWWEALPPQLNVAGDGKEKARGKKCLTRFDFALHETIFSFFLAQVLSCSYYCCSLN